jgi:hypothetical protein
MIHPPHRAAALDLVARVIARLDLSLNKQQLASLSRMTISGDLANDLFDAGISLPFPRAGQPLDGRLRQISSVRELHLAATRFRPCIKISAQQCLDGTTAFYIWSGREPAVVEVQRILGAASVVTDIRGLNNGMVTAHTCELIRSSFRDDEDHLPYTGNWPEDLFL